MDTYDIFGEDVGGSVLDGLPDLGSDSVAAQGGGYGQQPPYQMHAESPLAKLASFGTDFSSGMWIPYS